jgi:putative ABC transport system permease protein
MNRLRIGHNLHFGLQNLRLHKLRSLLTVLGIVFGVSSVIAMLSVGEGASREALSQIRKLGSSNIIITSQKPLIEKSGATQRVRMSLYGLQYDDNERIKETLNHIVRTVPVKLIRKEARKGERSIELRIVGTTPDWFGLVKRDLVAGRIMTWDDFRKHQPVCVLTEHAARRLLATEYVVGQMVRLGSEYFQVIGVVRSEQAKGSIQTPDRSIDAYIPLSAARERYGDTVYRRSAGSRDLEQVELHQILVEVDSLQKVEGTAAAIEAMLQHFHKKNDYLFHIPLGLLREAEATKRRFNIVLGSIAGISLLVGGIGIMNIMLASVIERTREIGIRRAIGAKRSQIIAQFLIETSVLSFAGGLIGVCVGILLPWLITLLTGLPTVIPLYGIILSLAISVGVGILFGIYPAARAAKLDPIIALRYE